MNKITTIIFAILVSFNLFANIEVKSFQKLEKDSTARVIAPKKGLNGQLCALVKVVSPHDGFIWKSDNWRINPSFHKNNTYYLYVPSNASKITVWHKKLGILRDYSYPIAIEKACVYELILNTENSVPNIEPNNKKTEPKEEKQWIKIVTTPEGADVILNEQLVGKSPYTKELPVGKYNWRVNKNFYFAESGSTELATGIQPPVIDVKLKKGFGSLHISSTPDKGALIFLDGVSTGKFTPCNLDSVPMGQHTITATLDMYDNAKKYITLGAKENKPIYFYMHPTFAEVSIHSDPYAGDIYINGALKARGKWNGRMLPGKYVIEAKNHSITATEYQNFEVGDAFNLILRPTDKTGTLKINTFPTKATVKIDGKHICQTPITLKNILIGTYTLQLSILGYKEYLEKITISENQTTYINTVLTNGRHITVSSTPSGAILSVDGNKIGKTPYNGIIAFGNHILQIDLAGEQAEKMVIIEEKGGETNFNMDFEMSFKTLTEKVNNVSFVLQPIRGGSFKMGSDNGESSEKPLHNVSVNSFYMAKTEVTQALWMTVMNENPSAFKGAELPVENVSWENVLQFIAKLNRLTAKKYRLPTEAEWEYAAGSIKGSKLSLASISSSHNNWSGTNKENLLENYCWNVENSNKCTHAVALLLPNAYGLYDMTGNVWEWCSDWYGNYQNYNQNNPTGEREGSYKVCRGGSWYSTSRISRVSYRNLISPNYKTDEIGFRLVLDAK